MCMGVNDEYDSGDGKDLTVKLIAQVFVRTTRFDPLHRGESEQALYLRLPGWLEELRQRETTTLVMEAGAKDVVYGTPVLPGAMFLYGRIDKTPILGLPACVLFYKATILDLVMPRVLAGEGITRRDLALMAHGGLCLNCEHCQFPVCPFGK